MTTQQKTDFKIRLQQKCMSIIEGRIAVTVVAIQNAQSAANEEEKSSAGDKYETSRAMSHLEKDMYARQLEVNKKELADLLDVNCNKLYDRITPGCIIVCDECAFFMAAGLGKMIFEGIPFFMLSPNAPVARLLLNKKQGDTIHFAKKDIVIEEVY